jgi:hypothetical protein
VIYRQQEYWSGRSKLLDGGLVVEEAAQAVLSLPESRDERLADVLLPLLGVHEPAIDLQPLHFLPVYAGESADPQLLHSLAVAGRLDYVRYRLLDELADAAAAGEPVSLSAHRLNAELAGLVRSHYRRALPKPVWAPFFETVAALYAGHSLSLAFDTANLRTVRLDLSLDDYVDHARARHGPARTSLDAVLLASDVAKEELESARESWHCCTLALQLYDDVLDFEEDLEARKFTWTVVHALEAVDGICEPDDAPNDPLALELIYRAALVEGVLVKTLQHAEAFLRRSARIAKPHFPSWVAFQEAGVKHMSDLRAEYEELADEARSQRL